MSDDDLLGEVQGLIQEAARTPGARIDADLWLVARALNIFTSNAALLRVQIEGDQRLEAWLRLGPDNQAEFERHLDEIDRLLHNFLAAAFTLASYTQRVRRRYANDDFDTEYARHAPFDDPVCRLIEVLRNDTQHAHLPVVQQRVTMGTEPPSANCRIVISRDYLECLDLDRATREYVQSHPSDPALLDLVDTYTRKVEEFVQWFVGAVVELRAEDLEETERLRRKAHELAEPLRRASTA